MSWFIASSCYANPLCHDKAVIHEGASVECSKIMHGSNIHWKGKTGWCILIFVVVSVAKLCPCSLRPHGLQHARLPSPSLSPEFAQTHVHRVADTIQPSHPLSSPSSPAFILSQHLVFFPDKSALCTRWPKYWSFSFSISPSSEYSRLISFRHGMAVALPLYQETAKT